VKRVPPLATDLTPDLGEQITRRGVLASLSQRDPLADTDHHCVWFSHRLLLLVDKTVAVTTDKAAVATCQ